MKAILPDEKRERLTNQTTERGLIVAQVVQPFLPSGFGRAPLWVKFSARVWPKAEVRRDGGAYTFWLMRKLDINYRLPAALFLAFVPVAVVAQTLLVVNQGDADVSLVDPASARQIATIAENTPGVHVHEIAVSADGRTAFAPEYGSSGVGRPGIDGHEMLVIDLASRKIVGDVQFGHGVRPHLPVMDPARGLLYVTTELDKTVTVIDPRTWKIVVRFRLGRRSRICWRCRMTGGVATPRTWDRVRCRRWIWLAATRLR